MQRKACSIWDAGGEASGPLSPRENVCLFPFRKLLPDRLAAAYFLLPTSIGCNEHFQSLSDISKSAYATGPFDNTYSFCQGRFFRSRGHLRSKCARNTLGLVRSTFLTRSHLADVYRHPKGARRPYGQSDWSAPTRNSATGGAGGRAIDRPGQIEAPRALTSHRGARAPGPDCGRVPRFRWRPHPEGIRSSPSGPLRASALGAAESGEPERSGAAGHRGAGPEVFGRASSP